MNKSNFLTDIRKINNEISRNSPAILIFLGITGMTTTVIMACKATPKAHNILEELHERQEELEEANSKPMQVLKDIKEVTPVYLPSVIMGGVSIACILGSYSITNKRTAALATAYSISERTIREYQEKVVETIGERKEEKIRDSIARDRVKNDNLDNHEVIVTGNGEMLCYDSSFGRYFTSSIEKLRKAESILNHRLISEMYISLNDFYDEIELPHVGSGDDLGWNVDELIELYFSSVLLDDDRTCLVVDYGIAPRYDYRTLY